MEDKALLYLKTPISCYALIPKVHRPPLEPKNFLSELLLASQGASCFTVPRGTPTGYPPRPEGSSHYCKRKNYKYISALIPSLSEGDFPPKELIVKCKPEEVCG